MSICESCNSFYKDAQYLYNGHKLCEECLLNNIECDGDAHDWSFTSCREFFWDGEKIGDDTCYEEVIDFLKHKVSDIEVLEGDS